LRRLLEALGRLWNHPEFPRWRENLCRYLEDLPVEVVSGAEEVSRFWQGMSFISEAALWAEVCLIALQKGRTTISPEDVPALAGSLNNLANRYSELNRREEALRAAEEAVGLYRQLAGANPAAFTPDLAMSLNNLAAFYSALNRREEALRAAEEAVELLIPFFVQIPEGFFPWMRTIVSTYTALAPDSPLTIPTRTGLALKDLSHHPRPEIADTARRLLEMVRFD
jgi:tetratricopeptide (TPR) repeat protein